MHWALVLLLWLVAAAAQAVDLPAAELELRYRDHAGRWQQLNWRGQVEVADTREARERGLMKRTAIADDRGMVFVYTQPQDLWFWMKDTSIALTALAFDSQCRVVSARPLVPLSAETVWLGMGQLVLELARLPQLPDHAYGSRQLAGTLRLAGAHPTLDPACALP